MELSHLIQTSQIPKVILRRLNQPAVEGTLCISSHYIILSSGNQDSEELWLLHRAIDSVEKKLGLMSGTVILKCKDFQIIQLDIPGVTECSNVAYSIEKLSAPDDPQKLYPFFYRALFDTEENGWTKYTTQSYFDSLDLSPDLWKISDINKDFKVCPSYPPHVIVPQSVEDSDLKASSVFRHLNRFPVLSYYYAPTKAALLRSSQPLVGPNQRRCKEDERLLNAALGPGSNKGFIVDTRAENIAQIARSKGGGFEPDINYPMWKRTHKAIEGNFAQMESLSKLVEACIDSNSSMDKWLSRLEGSGWLGHVSDVLSCACQVALCLHRAGSSVLVHGGEGLDSTLQVCSLAQVLLDPACRTLQGFQALVQREWIQAGHPFASRCRHGPFAPALRDHNPSFLLFLDCTYQVYQQFPCSFEFNEKFLTLLFEHAYASQFGTFLGNCERDRAELKLDTNTVSLWTYLSREEVVSPLRSAVYEPNSRALWPSVAPQSLELWDGLFLRWVMDLSYKNKAEQAVARIKQHDAALKAKAIKLRSTLVELEQAALNAGLLTLEDTTTP